MPPHITVTPPKNTLPETLNLSQGIKTQVDESIWGWDQDTWSGVTSLLDGCFLLDNIRNTDELNLQIFQQNQQVCGVRALQTLIEQRNLHNLSSDNLDQLINEVIEIKNKEVLKALIGANVRMSAPKGKEQNEKYQKLMSYLLTDIKDKESQEIFSLLIKLREDAEKIILNIIQKRPDACEAVLKACKAVGVKITNFSQEDYGKLINDLLKEDSNKNHTILNLLVDLGLNIFSSDLETVDRNLIIYKAVRDRNESALKTYKNAGIKPIYFDFEYYSNLIDQLLKENSQKSHDILNLLVDLGLNIFSPDLKTVDRNLIIYKAVRDRNEHALKTYKKSNIKISYFDFKDYANLITQLLKENSNKSQSIFDIFIDIYLDTLNSNQKDLLIYHAARLGNEHALKKLKNSNIKIEKFNLKDYKSLIESIFEKNSKEGYAILNHLMELGLNLLDQSVAINRDHVIYQGVISENKALLEKFKDEKITINGWGFEQCESLIQSILKIRSKESDRILELLFGIYLKLINIIKNINTDDLIYQAASTNNAALLKEFEKAEIKIEHWDLKESESLIEPLLKTQSEENDEIITILINLGLDKNVLIYKSAELRRIDWLARCEKEGFKADFPNSLGDPALGYLVSCLVEEKNSEIFFQLAQLGLNPDLLIYEAARFGNEELLTGLKDKGFRIQDQEAYLYLMPELMKSNPEIFQFLIGLGIDKDMLISRHGSLLNLAFLESNFEIATFLIEQGANVNTLNNKGRTALHILAGNKNKSDRFKGSRITAMRTLLEKGCDLSIKDKHDYTCLRVALVNPQYPVDVIKLLLNGREASNLPGRLSVTGDEESTNINPISLNGLTKTEWTNLFESKEDIADITTFFKNHFSIDDFDPLHHPEDRHLLDCAKNKKMVRVVETLKKKMCNTWWNNTTQYFWGMRLMSYLKNWYHALWLGLL